MLLVHITTRCVSSTRETLGAWSVNTCVALVYDRFAHSFSHQISVPNITLPITSTGPIQPISNILSDYCWNCIERMSWTLPHAQQKPYGVHSACTELLELTYAWPSRIQPSRKLEWACLPFTHSCHWLGDREQVPCPKHPGTRCLLCPWKYVCAPVK